MTFSEKFKSILQSPWIIALILTAGFYLVTGYKLGWDDQHLEIPLLKHLIDPELFKGDYYVESLQINFATYFYPILARCITVDQIPAAYFILYLISRYVMFFWIYKLWLLISGKKLDAFLCVMVFIVMVRVQEFLYRTFSHQEFALAIIFAGIYFFFKERFLLSALLFGLSANFHGLYSLFPMTYMCFYLLWDIKKHRFKTLLQSCVIYVVSALPFIIWVMQKRFLTPAHMGTDPVAKDWITLFIMACPQNFFFKDFPIIPFKRLCSDVRLLYHGFEPYLFLIILFMINIVFSFRFKNDRKAVAFCLSGFFFLIICFLFTYSFPIRFFIDLNLTRNTQFLEFLLMGYTTILLIKIIREESVLWAFILSLMLTFFKYTEILSCSIVGLLFSLLVLRSALKKENKILKYSLSLIALLAGGWCLTFVLNYFFHASYRIYTIIVLTAIFSLLSILCFISDNAQKKQNKPMFRDLFFLIPIIFFLGQYTYFHFEYAREKENPIGFWRLQKSWEDMQRFVSENTPKDTILLVPYNMEMGGFRIFSNRKIVVCYRDCGIIGFDYNAAVEWRKRVHDIETFKFNINQSPKKAIQNAVVKYHASYIVFLRYTMPGDENSILERVYTNMDFALFKLKKTAFTK